MPKLRIRNLPDGKVAVITTKVLDKPNASDVRRLPVMIAMFYGEKAGEHAKLFVKAKGEDNGKP